MEWTLESQPINYHHAMNRMAARVDDIKHGRADEWVWCLQHDDIYTTGTGGQTIANNNGGGNVGNHVITNRGGQTTWHGKGQMVCYVMIDLTRRKPDPHLFTTNLLSWAGLALASLGVATFVPKDKDKIGLWVTSTSPMIAKKIVAIGVRLSNGGQPRKMITSHGIAININPDLSVFNNIVPCGVDDPCYGVTSLQAEGVATTMVNLDRILQGAWQRTTFLSGVKPINA